MEKDALIKAVIKLHRRVNQTLRQTNQDAWMQLSLTVPQVKSLFYITNRGSTNFRDLAKALKVTPSNLTGVIDRLVDQSLVSRKENPEDRRIMLLKATARGEELVSDLGERRISHLSQALSELSPEELNTIVRGLTLLARITEAQANEALAS